MRRLFLLLVVVCCGAGAVYAQDAEDELLLPEQAFRLDATSTAEGVRLEWTIAEGYYLYRTKFRMLAKDEAVVLGEPSFPPGKIKEDEFFGPMEIYRDRVSVDLPVERRGDVSTLALEVTSQGCADLGVCYPPHTQTLELSLSSPTSPALVASQALSALGRLGDTLVGGDEPEFLEPDQAFQFSARALDGGTVLATWEIADGYYLYKDKFKFRVVSPPGASLGEAVFPPGKLKEDPEFGRVEAFYHRLDVRLPVTGDATARVVELQVGYQGCAEAGICYPPITRMVAVELPPGGAVPVSVPSRPAVPPAPVAEQDRLAELLVSGNLWVAMVVFFGVGLLLALTPCVFPMIPILSGIIVGQGSQITTRRAFTLSLVYVLAMSVTYTTAGVIAGLFGENLQAMLQNPWMLSAFSAVFVALALSMFGFYNLQIPGAWQAKLTELSNRQQGGTLIGVGVMGFLSALIVGPCVAPPLAAALIVIGQEGDPLLGGLALFALSLGMGAPLVAIGTLEGKYLPRAGGWMNAVKAVFGVMLLGVAIFLLDRVLPPWVILLLWAGLFIVSAIYMGALEPLGMDAGGFRKLWKGVGLVMLVYGVLLMIGAASGGKDMFQPLRAIAVAGGVAEADHELPFKPVKGQSGLEAELADASEQGRPVMLDFYADWCVTCKELERFTFSDPAVQAALAGAVLLQADVTANDVADQALLKAYGLIGPPAVLFFGPDGTERRPYRLVGFLGAEKFRGHAEQALN